MLNSFFPSSAFTITPSDSENLTETAFGIYVTVAGNVVYEDLAGTQWTDAVAAGGIITMSVRKVLATGTTATGIRGYRIN